MWSLWPKGKRLICHLSNAHKGMEWLTGLYRFSVCHFQGEISDVNRTKPVSSALAVNALKLCFHCHELSQLEHFIKCIKKKMSCFVLFIDWIFYSFGKQNLHVWLWVSLRDFYSQLRRSWVWSWLPSSGSGHAMAPSQLQVNIELSLRRRAQEKDPSGCRTREDWYNGSALWCLIFLPYSWK